MNSQGSEKGDDNATVKKIITMFYKLRSENKVPKKRIEQAQDYVKLKTTREVCNAVHEIRTQLKLKGEFLMLEKALVSGLK